MLLVLFAALVDVRVLVFAGAGADDRALLCLLVLHLLDSARRVRVEPVQLLDGVVREREGERAAHIARLQHEHQINDGPQHRARHAEAQHRVQHQRHGHQRRRHSAEGRDLLFVHGHHGLHRRQQSPRRILEPAPQLLLQVSTNLKP
eukprot:39045-Rhodomonas_salina.1